MIAIGNFANGLGGNFKREIEMVNAMVEKVLQNGMTVGELIAELESMDPDSIVCMISHYGDYGRTMQAMTVKHIEQEPIGRFVESRYSDSGVALIDILDEREGDDEGDDEEQVSVVCLSGFEIR